MRRLLLLVLVALLTLASPAWSAEVALASAELRPLNIATGTWTYHGENMAAAGQKAGTWTWIEKCAPSANGAFMACSFTMNGPDQTVKSLAISTYNYSDKSYWHYEMFDSDSGGADPFIARMTIQGNTWVVSGTADKKTYRVTYHYSSPTQVTVRIELSDDNIHWTTLAQGEGVKQA
jgi:hypothetical protein